MHRTADDCKRFDIGRGIVTYELVFASPSVDNTGQYVCSSSKKAPGSSIYIAVGNRNNFELTSGELFLIL